MGNNAANSKSPMLGALPRKFTMTALFILCYTVIHINFEYKYWMTDDRDIFGKYEVVGEQFDEVAIAKEVYFSKATWMIVMVLMMTFGMSFRSAIAYSFMFYSVELMFLFPIRTYTFLNLLLAMGCVIEDVVERLKMRPKEEPA
ncbi:MAG: hypothetical protein GY847_23905 [Proteobacteria bacterium]|nr:hypothetical protein [Pseudomonadota bacterium]